MESILINNRLLYNCFLTLTLLSTVRYRVLCGKMTEPVVKIEEGRVRGVSGQSLCGKPIYKFLGVPYGKTPIGDLRFKSPQPVEPWEGVKDATKDGSPSYNRDVIHEVDQQVRGGEDCLVLNVFTKEITPKQLKPVMVYIHGGGFVMGSNNHSIYGPEFLLTQDIVVVVINYRLGLLGFLSLEDKSLNVPGNAGLKDQVLALKWVQRNIKAFGGDPENVTIFGESAGSASVHFHILSQSSSGLFHKAILESGVAMSPWALGSSNGIIAADALGKPGISDQEVLNILKNMSGEEIFAIQEKTLDPLVFGVQRPYVPVIERPNPDAFITKDPIDILRSGEYNHVPLFIGYTSNEGLLLAFLKKLNPDLGNKYSYREGIPWSLNLNNAQTNKVEELLSCFYSQFEDPKDKELVMMDGLFLSPIVAAIVNHHKTTTCPIYVYRIAADNKRNFIKQIHNLTSKDTSHADELGYLWNIYLLPKIKPDTIEYLTVQRFVKLWTDFAKTGNPTPPNSDSEVILPPVTDVTTIPILNIADDLSVLDSIPEIDRVKLWKEIYSYNAKTSQYL